MFKTLIDVESLLDCYKNPDWLIIDARYDLADKDAGKKAYLTGHIPGAIYVDLHDDLSRPPGTNKGRHPLPTEETMNDLFSELGINEGMQVIVYDNPDSIMLGRHLFENIWPVRNQVDDPYRRHFDRRAC